VKTSTTFHEAYPPHREVEVRLDGFYQLWLDDEPVLHFRLAGRDILLTTERSPHGISVKADDFHLFIGDRPVKVGLPLL
jgi:hypothetical protein